MEDFLYKIILPFALIGLGIFYFVCSSYEVMAEEDTYPLLFENGDFTRIYDYMSSIEFINKYYDANDTVYGLTKDFYFDYDGFRYYSPHYSSSRSDYYNYVGLGAVRDGNYSSSIGIKKSIDDLFPKIEYDDKYFNLEITYYIKKSEFDSFSIIPFFARNVEEVLNDSTFMSGINWSNNMTKLYKKDDSHWLATGYPVCSIYDEDSSLITCKTAINLEPGFINGNNFGNFFVGFYSSSRFSYSDIYFYLRNDSLTVRYTVGPYSATVPGLNPEPTPTEPPSIDEEQLETSKGIFGKIGDIFNTLLEIPSKIATAILDGIKSLFIPSDGFFQDFFNKISDFFKEKLGFLSYPFVWTCDVLNSYLSLEDTGHYVLIWNDISVPNFESSKIIPAGSFDLADSLKNQNVKNAHDIYLAFVDTLVFLGFLALCRNKYSEIFGGSIDNTEYITTSEGYTADPITGEVLTQRYSRTVHERRKKE